MGSVQQLRNLSHVFSLPMFQKIVREEDSMLFKNQTEKYFRSASYDTNLDIIKSLYKSLQKHYRCEYIYKNNLLINIIKNHGLKSTLTLSELRIGASKADMVMLNGSIKVYEIKTELDGLDKLKKQISDYQKLADEVHIVTDNKYAQRLEVEYKNTTIGIMALNAFNKLETIKKANANTALFDFTTIFKVLRKQEYLDLVADNFGHIPNVPNTKIFKACYQLLSTIDIVNFQQQVLNKLKERRLSSPRLLKSSKTPNELKHICNSLDFNEHEYQKLYTFLATKTLCISHI